MPKEILVEKQFRIVGLIACPDEKILLTLEPIQEPTPTTMVEARPAFRSEEERIGYEMGLGLLKGMGQYGPVITMGVGPGGHPLIPRQEMSDIFNVRIPRQDYESLGTPTVNNVILLDIKVSVKSDDETSVNQE